MVCEEIVCEANDWVNIEKNLQTYRVAVVKNFWSDTDFELVKNYQSSVEDWFFRSTNKLDYLTQDADDQGYHQINEHWINPDYRDFKEGYGMRSTCDPRSLPPEWGEQFLWVRNKLFNYVEQLVSWFGLKDELSYDNYISYAVHYPPCETKHSCAPHFDRNVVTLIISHDPHKRLQVMYEKQWIDIPYVENSVVLMVGMSFQWLTDQRIKACWHQVSPTNHSSFSTILFSYSHTQKVNMLVKRWTQWKQKRAEIRDSLND